MCGCGVAEGVGGQKLLFIDFCHQKLLILPFYHHSKTHRHSGSLVEVPLCDREVVGSFPGQVIPKTLKMVLAALSLGAQH